MNTGFRILNIFKIRWVNKKNLLSIPSKQFYISAMYLIHYGVAYDVARTYALHVLSIVYRQCDVRHKKCYRDVFDICTKNRYPSTYH